VFFSGGLFGYCFYGDNYPGDFNNTPIFIGSSDPDPHIPVKRVDASTKVLEEMNAAVTAQIYENMGHTISQQEITKVNELLFSV
jgi:phospholipase/carboxylesterase